MKVIDVGLAIMAVIIKRNYLNLDIKDLAFFPLFYFSLSFVLCLAWNYATGKPMISVCRIVFSL
jgi:hypothetical protein